MVEERVELTAEQFFDGDVHVARVIGTMALQHRDHGTLLPRSFAGDPDGWHRLLTRIGEPLLAYASRTPDLDAYEDLAIKLRARRALELYAHWFTEIAE
jgi:hypothetical protein